MAKKVRICFGFYGSRHPETEVEINGKIHKKLGCTHLCNEVKLCKECYWFWYFAKKKKDFKVDEYIKNFMKKHNLEKW